MTTKTIPVSHEQLKLIERELDACQKVIHLVGGFDPAYCEGAQKQLAVIRTMLKAPQVESEPYFWYADCDDSDYSGLYNTEEEALNEVNDHGGDVMALYAEPQASVTVLLPERIGDSNTGFLAGYNQALDDVAKLNATPIPIELLRDVCATGLSYSERQALLDELRELIK